MRDNKITTIKQEPRKSTVGTQIIGIFFFPNHVQSYGQITRKQDRKDCEGFKSLKEILDHPPVKEKKNTITDLVQKALLSDTITKVRKLKKNIWDGYLQLHRCLYFSFEKQRLLPPLQLQSIMTITNLHGQSIQEYIKNITLTLVCWHQKSSISMTGVSPIYRRSHRVILHLNCTFQTSHKLGNSHKCTNQ